MATLGRRWNCHTVDEFQKNRAGVPILRFRDSAGAIRLERRPEVRVT